MEFDPFFFGILFLVLAFFFFVYLMIRRTLVAFKEGQQR